MINQFIKAHDRLPVFEEYNRKNRLVCWETAKRYLGNINEYYKKNYPEYCKCNREEKLEFEQEVEDSMSFGGM